MESSPTSDLSHLRLVWLISQWPYNLIPGKYEIKVM